MRQDSVTFWCDYTACSRQPLTVAEDVVGSQEVPPGWVQIEIRRPPERISVFYTTHEECLADWFHEQAENRGLR